MGASTVLSTVVLTSMVSEEYGPRLRTIGTDARDHAVPREYRYTAVVLRPIFGS
jgi:hypothetical protein